MIDSSLLDAIVNGLLALSGWEVFASLLGIGYVIFAARESQWCWPLAFVSTTIYTLLFWEDQLPMQALLNFYYMGMAVYGYLLWKKQSFAENNLAISKFSWFHQVLFLLIGSALTYTVASYLQSANASQSPFLDAGVTVFSVLNTILMARKILQNWLYWIVIDAAAIQLYYETGYYATIVMFSVYLVLALVGYLNWMKLYYKEPGLPH